MVTIKAVIKPPRKSPNGLYPVKIRVTHKGVSRWLKSNLVAKEFELRSNYSLKENSTTGVRANKFIGEMFDAISDLPTYVLDDADVDRIISHMQANMRGSSEKDGFTLNFFEYASSFISKKKADATKKTYETALNAFAGYLGTRELDINSISPNILMEFVDTLNEGKKLHFDKKTKTMVESKSLRRPGLTAGIYLKKLEAIFCAAKKEYKTKYGEDVIRENPFAEIEINIPASENGQRNLGRETIQKIILSDPVDSGERIALDAFIVSFGLMGINLADLLEAKTPKNGYYEYYRKKTRNRVKSKKDVFVRVKVSEHLRPYISRLRNGYEDSAMWLPVLSKLAHPSQYMRQALHRWCDKEGVEKFTFNAARHSWASIARSRGIMIDEGIVDAGMGHKGEHDMLKPYVDKDFDAINDANEQVLNLFDWGEVKQS